MRNSNGFFVPADVNAARIAAAGAVAIVVEADAPINAHRRDNADQLNADEHYEEQVGNGLGL